MRAQKEGPVHVHHRLALRRASSSARQVPQSTPVNQVGLEDQDSREASRISRGQANKRKTTTVVIRVTFRDEQARLEKLQGRRESKGSVTSWDPSTP